MVYILDNVLAIYGIAMYILDPIASYVARQEYQEGRKGSTLPC